jgi:inner membrane protein
MTGKTHLIAGLTTAVVTQPLLTSNSIQLDNIFVYVLSCIIGSIIPDICHPKSLSGRKTKFLSTLISKLFGHRTITHSLLFVAITYWLTSLLPTNMQQEIQLGLTLGIISHLILDAMTTRGIQLFYPLDIKVRFPIYIKTGTSSEYLITSSLLIVTVYFMYKLNLNLF